MLTKLREPFGKAGLIVAIVALIAALGGGAYAASGGLSGKQKKEVEKIAKKYAGKNGTNGTNGAPGAKGDTGAAGTNGTNGTNGSPGGPGAAGKSVEEVPIAAGPGEAACEERGGAEYLLEGATEGTEVCNGKEGSPWALGGLPKGATETGVWTFGASEASSEGGRVYVPISFSVPLRQKITDEANVHFVGPNGDGTTCKGKVTAPTAPEGVLCVYRAEVVGAEFVAVRELLAENNEVDTAGAYLVFREAHNESYGRGSFAVTGN